MPFQALQGTCKAWQPSIKVTARVTCRTKLRTRMIQGLTHTLRHLLENSFPRVLPAPSNVRQSWGIVGWNSVERSREPILPRIQRLHRRRVPFRKDVPCADIKYPLMLSSVTLVSLKTFATTESIKRSWPDSCIQVQKFCDVSGSNSLSILRVLLMAW